MYIILQLYPVCVHIFVAPHVMWSKTGNWADKHGNVITFFSEVLCKDLKLEN